MAKSKKSGLSAKYGSKLNKAVQDHAGDETTYGVIELPPNIKNGIARLKIAKFDVYKTGKNQGEYYFQAQGIVVEPKEVEYQGQTIQVKNLRTMYMEPVCDTSTQAGKVTTQEQHIEKILNIMRGLGGEDFTEGASADNLEELAEALQEAQPYFKFSTSPKFDMNTKEVSGCWENWHGGKGLEDYTPPEEDDEVEDETEEEEEEEAPKNSKKEKPAAKAEKAGKKPVKEPEEEEETEEEVFDDGAEDLTELADKASDGDEEAAEKLIGLATEKGFDRDTVENADSWADVVKMIEEGGEGSEEEETEEEDKTPEVGDTVEYEIEVKNPKTKKTEKKVLDCEITKVNAKKSTVNLKAQDAKRTEYKDVPFSDLL